LFKLLWNETHVSYHTMKFWERVIEHMLRQNIKISENQFEFMPRRSTTEAIHLLRQLIEQFLEEKFAYGLYWFRKKLM